jgi:tripartite-type tricarboxylate transporter receptor subunit TctC
MRRRQLVQLAAAGLAAPAFMARAQAFPSKPIRLQIAFPAGGPTDITMRSLADSAGKLLGQPVVVENRPGAGGTLPAQALQTAAPDGYTLAQIPLGVFRLPYTTKINWDPVKDIAYVLNVTGYAFGLVVPTDSPLKTWAQFVAYAKANPGKLSYGSTGIGSSMHLAGELYSREYGAQMVHVPFSNPGNATTNLISGEIQLMFQLIPGIASQVKAGRVRAIGVMASQRSPALPDVPTMVELGAPKLMSSTWFALLAPKGTPVVAIERMNAALNEVLADPAVKKRLSDIGASTLGGTPKQLADHLAAEIDKWGRVVRDAKISVQ